MENTDDSPLTRRIYYIKCDLDEIIYYIGSTTHAIDKRFCDHKKNFKYWINGHKTYTAVFDKFKEIGVEHFSIYLLKEYHNIDKKGILAMEALWICKMRKDKKCKLTNKLIPFRAGDRHLIEDTKQINKSYNEKNKEDKSIKHKQYREANKNKFKCEICNFYTYCQSDLNKHNKTDSHKIKSGEGVCKNIIQTFNYICSYCNIQTNDRRVFVKHLKSNEHIGVISAIEEEGIEINIDFQYNHSCDICKFYTDNSKDYRLHLKSRAHFKKTGVEYNPYSNLGNKNKHTKNCKYKIN